LPAKLDRALAEASKVPSGQAFWVGYAIDRLQGEHSTIGSTFGDRVRRPTIAEVLAGKGLPGASEPSGGDLRSAAAEALDELEHRGKPEKQVLKELGFFLKYKPGRPAALESVGMSNLDLSFDFEAAPLYWLGKAPEEQSLGLVRDLYGRASGPEAREHLIAAAGCHGTPRLVLPFLESVLGSADPDDLRKDAAFWIGQQNDAAGLRTLSQAARTDRSEEVREGAVFAISQLDLEAAVDELIALARGAEKRDVRKQAVFWLSQLASKKAGGVLEDIASGDADLEIQEQALFALSELPDNAGLEPLIRLAKSHRDARIRKKAVFWLGESSDPRALEAIVAIIKGK
jgi:HEAT repeat protein